MMSNDLNKDPACLWDDSDVWIKYYSWETPFHQVKIPLDKSRFESSEVSKKVQNSSAASSNA